MLCWGCADKFATVLREQQEVRRNKEQQRIRLLSADPFDMEAQRLIANEIQQEVRRWLGSKVEVMAKWLVYGKG